MIFDIRASDAKACPSNLKKQCRSDEKRQTATYTVAEDARTVAATSSNNDLGSMQCHGRWIFDPSEQFDQDESVDTSEEQTDTSEEQSAMLSPEVSR